MEKKRTLKVFSRQLYKHVANIIAANLPLRILHAPLLFLNLLPQCYTTLSPQLVCVVQSEKHIKYYLLQVLEFYPYPIA